MLPVIESYYRRRFGLETSVIPYGAGLARTSGTATLEKWGLDPGGYFLYVSRLEPENNAHAVIAGFERAGLDRRLVVVGDAPYHTANTSSR